MNDVVTAGAVVASTEFVKRVVNRLFGFQISGELTIILAVILGGLIAFGNDGNVLQGAIVGAAAVGGVTTADRVATVVSK